MNWVEATGYLASALVLATFCMKTIIRALRCHQQQYCLHRLWILRRPVPCSGAARNFAATECMACYPNASLDKTGRGGLQRRSLYRMVKVENGTLSRVADQF